MLDLRTIDPARQSADRRVALVIGFVAIGTATFVAVSAGAGGWAMAVGAALVLAELPWFLAFGARWRLLDDALRGVPFAWRGDRAGVWAIAPVSGALVTLVLTAALGFPSWLAFLACLAGGALHVGALWWAESRYERAILLDLTVLELRFRRITDARVAAGEPPRAAIQ
jgi:hypothetical protein